MGEHMFGACQGDQEPTLGTEVEVVMGEGSGAGDSVTQTTGTRTCEVLEEAGEAEGKIGNILSTTEPSTYLKKDKKPKTKTNKQKPYLVSLANKS